MTLAPQLFVTELGVLLDVPAAGVASVIHGCSAKPGRNIAAFEGFNDLKGIQYDAACRQC